MSGLSQSISIPARDFPQKCGIGDYCVLLGSSGPTAGKTGGQGLVQITAVEPIYLLDQHGVVIVWVDPTTSTSQTAPVAGYGSADVNYNNSHISAGSSQQTNGSLQKLQLLQKQFAQFRFRLKWLVQPTGAVQDYDVQVLNPVNTQRGSLAHVNAVINGYLQPHDTNDIVVLPAQGSNEAAPAANNYDGQSWWEAAARTEQFVLEDNSLGVKIVNNGSAVTAAGALGLQIAGYVYNFDPIEAMPGSTPLQYLKNSPIMLPPGVDRRELIPIQIGARNPW